MICLTQWFGPNRKPVHPGVYQRKVTGLGRRGVVMYAYWNGRRWSPARFSVSQALTTARRVSAMQDTYQWRGTAK
jgi:hypothetical protein